MKKYIVRISVLLATITAVFGCSSDSYDDSKLWEELNSLANRVSKLESTLSSMNSDISSLQSLVGAMEGYIRVTNITETATGYRISFSNGSVVEINNNSNGETPVIGNNGNWWIGNRDTGVKAVGSDGLTPHIGNNGNWWIGTIDTGVKAAGSDGLTPHIGNNGNWWIGTTDTGVKAAGSDGLTPHIGDNGHWWIGSTDTGVSATVTGGEMPADVPIIGVDLYEGVYYWTVTVNGVKSWLTNTDGNMIPVVGNGGAGSYRPILQVNALGYWTISYDGGITFEYILDAYGKYVSAMGTGGGGCNCETFFRSVSYSNGILVLVLIDGTVVTIDTNNNGGGYDDRLDDVVPPELQASIANHMPIYPGKNPPLIEGAYFVDPFVAVYCEDYGNGGYPPGYQVTSETIRFANQNTTNNTLDYAEYSTNGNVSAEGTGAFISGTGNNFTAFFNTIGQTSGVSTKTALVISGTKTADGIADLYYAFVMVEKGYDPSNKVMKEGVFRVFKDQDGLSVNTTWNGTRSLENGLPVPEWTIYSFFSAME